jgi:membrane protease YdiL (CAAX protease family)
VIGFVVIGGVAFFVERGQPRGDADPGIALVLTFITLCFEVWAGLAVLLLARWRGISMHDLGFVRPRGAGWGVISAAVVGAYAAMIGYVVVMAIVGRLTGFQVDPPKNTIPETLARTTAVWVLLGFALVLAAPFGEELFFRGLVYRAVAGFWGPALGILVSGIAFALMHFNLSVVVPFALIGMIFAAAYRSSGSIWTTIAAHAIFNGVSFALAVSGIAK